jgi:hypothetical protein
MERLRRLFKKREPEPVEAEPEVSGLFVGEEPPIASVVDGGIFALDPKSARKPLRKESLDPFDTPLGKVQRAPANLLRIAATLYVAVNLGASLLLWNSSPVVTAVGLAFFLPNALLLWVLRGRL